MNRSIRCPFCGADDVADTRTDLWAHYQFDCPGYQFKR